MRRVAGFVAAGIALFACTDRSRPAPAAPDAAPAASVAVDAGLPAPTSAPALPASDFGPRGPFVLVGYPKQVGRNPGYDVAATDFGITDGGFAYCADNFGDMATGATHSSCVFNDGTKRTVAVQGFPKDRLKYVADHHLRQTHFPEPLALGTMPPKLEGDWRFARDITVNIEATTKADCEAAGSFRIGGTVTGEKPVWFAVKWTEWKNPCNSFAFIDAAALSDNGEEFGAVFRTNGAHSDSEEFTSYYAKTERIAAQIYNDTGFRHHKAKDYARAAELFLLAANAAPDWELPAYNLACAWNRAGDARASVALDVAIARGGDAVKKRAQTDDDLKSLNR